MRRSIIALALLVSGVSALATTRRPVPVTCPVCAATFTGHSAMSTNTFGGQDRDYLGHARGHQVFLFALWTCPKCHYSGYQSHFRKEQVAKELAERIRVGGVLKPGEPIDPRTADTASISPWVRYDLRLQVLALVKGARPVEVAWTALRAAQTQRFNENPLQELADSRTRVAALLARVRRKAIGRTDYDRTMSAAGALEELAGAGSPLSAADRALALIVAARLYKRRGEDPDARRILAVLAGQKGLEKGIAAEMKRLAARCDRERKYVLMAAARFREALSSGAIEPGSRPNLRYLIGELHRKAGEKDKALAELRPLAAEKGHSAWLVRWVADAIGRAEKMK